MKLLKAGFTMLTGMLSMMAFALPDKACAQNSAQMVRLAKLVIDSAQLELYKAALKEGVEAAMRLEPGVLVIYPVAEKDHPTHFTILEIYADEEAYKAHLKSPHFLKYKTSTKDMVKSLELVATVPLVPGLKIK